VATDPQREIVDFLLQPTAYRHRPAAVEHLQTPISHVFVAPPFAYKLKKPVTLSFLDFGTRARRRAACEDETRLNRRLCRPIYLGVVPVTRTAAGFEIGGPGPAVEHLVWMRALPAAGMLPVALEGGRVDVRQMRRFGRELADFHARAPGAGPRVHGAEPDRLRARWQDVLDNCAPFESTLLSPSGRAVLTDFGALFLAAHHDLFSGRTTAGRIREGHGDLHCANLCLVEPALPAIEGAPRVDPGLYAFDCIEFSEELRWNDVASEVAFLVMDLEVRGEADLARSFLDAYEEHSSDTDLRRLLPYYVVHRACVRGMVHGQTARDPGRSPEARERAAERSARFFAHAVRSAWQACGPALVVCTGLSGSGKTTIAAHLAERTGFVHLSSDEIRKRRAGLDPLEPTPPRKIPDLYRSQARARVYAELARRAEAALRAGHGVFADATFTRRADRDVLSEVARRLGRPRVFLECSAGEDVVRARLSARAHREVPSGHGARSDADWAVYRRQVAAAEPLGHDETALRIDTGAAALADVIEEAALRLCRWRARIGLAPVEGSGSRVTRPGPRSRE